MNEEEKKLIATAQRIATSAHAGQTDQGGQPYIGHPQRVATRLADQGAAPEQIAAGWLHDVLEDTDWTADMLRQEGISNATITLVEAMTHPHGEPNVKYAARLRACPGAVQIKLADIADNTDPKRMAVLDDERRERMTAKYIKMRRLLAEGDTTVPDAGTDIS